ncbi:MAG: tetratricopeptide repeat protein [Acidovorax sp.]
MSFVGAPRCLSAWRELAFCLLMAGAAASCAPVLAQDATGSRDAEEERLHIGLQRAEQAMSEDSPPLEHAIRDLALHFEDAKQHQDAITAWQRLLPLRERRLGVDASEVAWVLARLGLQLEHERRYVEALQAYERNLAIIKQRHGERSSEAASALYLVARTLRNLRRYSEAINAYLGCTDILEHLPLPQYRQLGSALFGAGSAYLAVEDGSKALPFLLRSLELLEATKPRDNHAIADAMQGIARAQALARNYSEALAMADRGLEFTRRAFGIDDPWILGFEAQRARTLTELARQTEARDIYERIFAAKTSRHGGNPPELARMAHDYGLLLLYRMDRSADAITWFERSLALAKDGMNPGEADDGATRGHLAEALASQGRIAEALEHGRYAVDFYKRRSPSSLADQAWAMHLYAVLLSKSGQHAEAIALFERSMILLEKDLGPGHPKVAHVLNNLGVEQWESGRMEDGLKNLQRALAIRDATLSADDPAVTRSLLNLATVLSSEYRFAEAEPLFLRAISIEEGRHPPHGAGLASALSKYANSLANAGDLSAADALTTRSVAMLDHLVGQDGPKLAHILLNAARIQRLLGQDEKAMRLANRALQALDSLGDVQRPELLPVLQFLASSHAVAGRSSDAIATHRRAFDIALKVYGPDHPATATELFWLGRTALQVGLTDLALWALRRSLDIREKFFGQDHPDLASNLNVIGEALRAKGDASAAATTLKRAWLLASRTSGLQDLKIRISFNLSQAYRQLGQPALAIVWGKESVNGVQATRININALERETQDAFLRSKAGAYDQLADILVAEGRIAEAQQVLQMLKEQELFETQQRAQAPDARATRAELTGLEYVSFSRFYALRDGQIALVAERQQLEIMRATRRLSAVEAKRLDELVQRLLPEIADAMQRFLETLESDMQATDVERSKVPTVQAAQTLLARAVAALATSEPRAKAVGLQYVFTDTRLSIILTVPGGPPLARQIVVNRQELHGLITRFSEQLSKRADMPYLLATSRRLHQLLIAPIEADLKAAGARTLMLSLTDALRYVPFAALHDGDHYLVQDFALAMFNEAGGQALEKAPVPDWRVAGMGLSESVDGLRPLPAVAEEINGIVRSPEDAFLNTRFNRRQLHDVLGSDYNVLHLASHFVFQPGRADASWLYLGDKSRLTLADISREKLDFRRFELVTLSACETGRGGGRDASGDEVESLGAKTQMQGAQAVMATLWNVGDASSSAFMQQFYRGQASRKVSNKAESLRTVQLAMLESRLTGIKSSRDWRHPYYWAPFVLMGNWR